MEHKGYALEYGNGARLAEVDLYAGEPLPVVEDDPESDDGTRYAVDGWSGVAFNVYGPEAEPDEDTEWTGLYRATGKVWAVMVGDDEPHAVDPEELTPLADDDYCPECGQVGCAAYG